MDLYQRAKRFLWMLFAFAVMSSAVTVYNRTGNWPPQSGTAFSFGGPFEVAWQACPTSLTSLDTKDSHLLGVTVLNTTGSPITFTIQANTGTIALPLTGAVAANTSVAFNIPYGLLAIGGFSVQASGSGLNYSAVWTH